MASVDFKEKTRERGKMKEKSLKSLKSLTVSQSHVKSGILYKLLYSNVLSFLLHYLLVI